MILSTLVFLAQAPATPARPAGGMQMMDLVIYMGFAFVLLYFLSIRPQQRRAKEMAAKISALKTGDKVVTSGGIHGLVANLNDGATLTLKIADNVKIEVEKSSVTTILTPAEIKA